MKCRGSCKYPLCARQQENQEQDKDGAASGGAVYDIKGQLASVHSWLQACLITLHRHAHKYKCTHIVHIHTHSTHTCTHVRTWYTHIYSTCTSVHTVQIHVHRAHTYMYVHTWFTYIVRAHIYMHTRARKCTHMYRTCTHVHTLYTHMCTHGIHTCIHATHTYTVHTPACIYVHT